MLELSILGFLAEQPLHGYELKERIRALSGHVRPVSDGALYPAIKRLVAAGLLTERVEEGASAAPRRVLSLTGEGRAELERRLRSPKPVEISDQVRFNTVLAFLRHLPDRREQAAVLRRRLDFLEEPSSFFYEGDRPVAAEDAGDLFRQGMLRVARATGRAEREWLREAVAVLEGDG
ncbi:PadR family transcriptional regulator [Streptomyces sp. XM83C]|uniref:PadR family transcriptional regulator n=1 Tax=Streptomyces thermocoprophilus TaxID=78356 RepID=A0ABV5VFM3_9ACTN|nr:PadR family transcriptional regulator [Streptomyces sp. XM83C]MCK1819933.1 PadR family transcriptional regulator [Streptomyces sp. XM83C]